MKKYLLIMLMLVSTNLLANPVKPTMLEEMAQAERENTQVVAVEICKRGSLYLVLVSATNMTMTQMLQKDYHNTRLTTIPCKE